MYPENVPPVIQMQWPTDVESFFLPRTVQYLARLSDIADLLRQLSQRNASWVLLEGEKKSWADHIKAAILKPLFYGFFLQDEGTLQRDASCTGLGAVLLQDQQRVIFEAFLKSRADTQK